MLCDRKIVKNIEAMKKENLKWKLLSGFWTSSRLWISHVKRIEYLIKRIA